ncbi:MAG TPA: POTRA domain-containing protein [Kofleriaceae bacterium]|nr:POTRA domain-containing protein [Kofleriaceae bacterium]
MTGVRTITLLAALSIAIGWEVVHQLPDGDAGTVAHLRPQEIASVALDGRGLPSSALRSVLSTKPGDQLDRARLDHDRAALEAALVARGFLAAKVQPARVVFDGDGGAYVTFTIARGPAFRVREVAVSSALRDAGVVTIASGDPAVASHIASARDALEARLEARGQHAVVTTQLQPDLAAGAVDIVLATR